MISPSVETLEQSIALVQPKWLLDSQLKELHAFGPERAKRVGAAGVTSDFEAGYQFGLRVARQMLAQSAALALAKVDPEDVL